MREFQIKCNDCRHEYTVKSPTALMGEDKHCPKCGSDAVRQTLKSYLRNGPLLDERWACGNQGTGFG